MTPSHGAGFSLIEVLTAIAVATILAAMAIPQFRALRARYQLSNGARQVITDLQRARVQPLRALGKLR